MLLNMKVARIKKGITQTQLAESVGISRNTVVGIENGYINPNKTKYSTLKAISNKLDLSIEKLLEENPKV